MTNKNVRALWTVLVFVTICYLAMSGFAVYLIATSGGSAPKYLENPEIDYLNLTDSQIEKSKAIIKEIKPLYLNFAKRITIVKDMKDFCNSGRF